MTEPGLLLQIGNDREQPPALDQTIRSGIDAGPTGARSLERWRGASSVLHDGERARPWSGANRSSGQRKTTGAPTPIVSPLVTVIDELSGSPERSERSAPSKLF
jgi:hypothetical protein